MSDTLILEFDGGTAEDYRSVNALLGIDPDARTGDVPAGLIHHQAAVTASGNLVVLELWESEAAFGAFMESRLGPALAQAGMPDPLRIEWGSTVGVIQPW